MPRLLYQPRAIWSRIFRAGLGAILGGYLTLPVVRGQDYAYYFTTIAGQPGVAGSADGTNGAALFYRPSYLAVDPSGAVYVSDTFNNTIRKLTPVGHDWVVTTIAGQAGPPGARDGTNGVAQFYSPNGLAFNAAGDLFVADHQSSTVRRIRRQGSDWVVTTIAGLAGASVAIDGTNSDARFRLPIGLTVDAGGRVFTVDSPNSTIRLVEPIGSDWVVSTIAGYPANYGFRDGLNQAAQFNYPYAIAFGPDGALYVSDWGNCAIRQVAAVAKGWNVSTIANTRGVRGTNDGPARSATFDSPNGIVLDSGTNIFVTDQGKHTVRKLTWSGRDWDVTTIGGVVGVHGTTDGLGTNALFWMPWGVAVSAGGAVYVADAYNHTIRRGIPAIALQIAAAAPGTVAISWPTSPDGFRLERQVLPPGAGIWETITSGIAVAGQRYTVTNSATGGAVLYRLKRDQ